jgi:hypothetical protein
MTFRDWPTEADRGKFEGHQADALLAHLNIEAQLVSQTGHACFAGRQAGEQLATMLPNPGSRARPRP